MRTNQVSQMPRLIQVLAGRLYDAAFEAGKKEGFRQGVDAVANKESEIHKRIYDQGAKDANHFGSAAFSAAACIALHDHFGFGKIRLKRAMDSISETLIGMLEPSKAIKRVREWGINIEYGEMLDGEMDEWDDLWEAD